MTPRITLQANRGEVCLVAVASAGGDDCSVSNAHCLLALAAASTVQDFLLTEKYSGFSALHGGEVAILRTVASPHYCRQPFMESRESHCPSLPLPPPVPPSLPSLQVVGAASTAILLSQICLAGFMPPAAFAAVAACFILSCLVNALQLARRLPAAVWDAWLDVVGVLGLAVLPQVMAGDLQWLWHRDAQ